MNEKALKTLEYDKILNMLAEKAVSPMGKEAALSLRPSVISSEIRECQQETTDAVSMLYKKGSLPLGGMRDIRAALGRVAIGGVLNIMELMHISETLYVCRKIKNYAKQDVKHTAYPSLDPKFELITLLVDLEAELNRCILNENEIADDASPKLRDIRRSIKQSNSKIQESLNSIIHSQTYKNMLQDNIVTIRNGRFCVPVKSEYRNTFSGMVHDQSSTGATLFMEPMGVVSLNNKIKELLADEEREIQRILAELSALVDEQKEIIQNNLDILTNLDFIFAKGELSLRMNGTEPVFNTKGIINIRKGRHPLLNPQTVVPTDIYLGDTFTTLLITGPNTGGKTVSLKVLGLFTLMGQAGLHIAAGDASELSVFDAVYADIGDEQSIEQSLSTFSGHMTNIVNILSNVTDNSLVLLDELGAGTDPTEGAALGISIIRYLFDRRIRTAVTTHYSELKVFALSTEGIENAACEFDVSTLRPTYRLLIGVPGKSNAFAISRRLGLPEHIINSAKEFLSHEDERFEDIITDLEISKKTVVIEQERAEAFRREAEKLKADYENQKRKLDEARDKLLQKAREDAAQILEESKDAAGKILKEMRQMSREGAAQKDIDAKRMEVKGLLDDMRKETAEQSHAQKRAAKPITKPLMIGDRVYVHSLNQQAKVLTLPDSSGKMMVQSGIMKISVKLSDLSLDESKEPVDNKARAYQANLRPKNLSIRNEIDLRGKMVDEALSEVDDYLDACYIAGLNVVSIIHGKGTGALRAAITAHLQVHHHVKSHRLGKFGEGETGVTIVEIDR